MSLGGGKLAGGLVDAGERLVEGAGARAIEGSFRGLGADGSLLLDGPDGGFAVASGELA